MITHYIKVAIRNMQKHKAQTIICILGLSVGLFCFSLCTYLLRYWMDEDNGFSNKERIVEITIENKDGQISGTPAYLRDELYNRVPSSVECITTTTFNRSKNLFFEISESNSLPYETMVMETDSNFLHVFNIPLLAGDPLSVYKTPNALLLSQLTANKIFGTTNPVGKKVVGQDQKAYVIAGVFKDFPKNNSLSPHKPIEVLALSVLDGLLSCQDKNTTGCLTYALLPPGKTASELDKQIQITDYKVDLFNQLNIVKPYPLGYSKYLDFAFQVFYGFVFFIGLLIFLSALLNYFSFFTGNFFNRIKEFSIRKGIGENKMQLFLLLFTELFLSLLITGIIALCLVELIAPEMQFSLLVMQQIEFDTLLLSQHIGEYLLICLGLAIIICGTVCFRINRYSLQEGIHFSRHRVRNILLGIQYFIALLFLTAAAITSFQTQKGKQQLFSTLSNAEKGRIFFVRTDYSYLEPAHQALLAKWKENSLVEDVLLVKNKLSDDRTYEYRLNEEDEKENFYGGILFASRNICSFLHLSPVTGTLQLNEQSMLVDEGFMATVKENPVNKTIRINKDPKEYRINGVVPKQLRSVENYRSFSSLAICLSEDGGNCYVRIQPGKEKEGKAYLTKTMQEFLPKSVQPEIYSLKDECQEIQMLVWTLRNIFLFFAIVCLIIILLGIYAAISQDTERRQKEVAIRKINGASLKTILILFTKLYLKLLVIASLFVFPLMWLLTDSTLRGWTIRFNYNNPLFWTGIFLTMVLITGITVFWKIFNTARINPAEVVKNE